MRYQPHLMLSLQDVQRSRSAYLAVCVPPVSSLAQLYLHCQSVPYSCVHFVTPIFLHSALMLQWNMLHDHHRFHPTVSQIMSWVSEAYSPSSLRKSTWKLFPWTLACNNSMTVVFSTCRPVCRKLNLSFVFYSLYHLICVSSHGLA